MRLVEVEADPRPIAVARIGLGLATVMNAVETFAVLDAIAGGDLARPIFGAVPTPTHVALLVYLTAAVLAGVAISVGFGTAAAAIVSTILSLGVLSWDEQTYSSHRVLAMLLVLYLVFARSDHAWSVTARASTRSMPVPWWPQLLMMTQLSVGYWFAALSKINPTFLSGDGLRSWVWWSLPDWTFGYIAIATIVAELFLAVALWFTSTRRLAVLVGLCLHLSIVVMLRGPFPLLAFALECVCLYGLFLWRPLSFPVRSPSRLRSANTPVDLNPPNGRCGDGRLFVGAVHEQRGQGVGEGGS